MTFRVVPTPLPVPVTLPEIPPRRTTPDLTEAFLQTAGIADRVELLRDPETLVVTTGQQPGLLTGPLYTIHKALSAAALARQLEHRWGRPVVAVFWIAGDDHDFAEGNHVAWHGMDGELETQVLRERPPTAPMVPLQREPVGEEIDAILARLEASLPPSEFRGDTMDWLQRHYRPSQTLGGAFGAALAELVAPYGVVCLDATHRMVKAAAVETIRQALQLAPGIDAALSALREERTARGEEVSVQVGDGATLVFLDGDLGRDRLVIAGEGFVTRRAGSSLSAADVESLLRTVPERFSPNVLLRPVVEAAILPTVAYVAGPGELRYFPLAQPVYEVLGVRPQRPLPRWSGIVVEPRVDRVLEKLGVDTDALREVGALEGQVARDALPDDLLAEFDALRADINRRYEVIATGAVAIDPTMEKPVRSAQHQAANGASEVERKLLQHQKKRSATVLSQIARARSALYPGGKPQERAVTVAPFLARYGRDLLARLSAEVEAWYAGTLDRR